MEERGSRQQLRGLLDELTGSARMLPRVWGRRSFWQIRLRWWVPPLIAVGVGVGHLIGYRFRVLPILLVAAGILAYNALLALFTHRLAANLEREPLRDRRWVLLEVGLDYAAMFLLIGLTGGVASPLLFFFLFHVIFAAIQFRAGTAQLFAGIAIAGSWILLALQSAGVLSCPAIGYLDSRLDFHDHPAHFVAQLLFFSGTVAITAVLATRIMTRLRTRVRELTRASGAVADLNDRLDRLHTMLRVIGREQRLQPILDRVCSELAAEMGVKIVAVKLLSEDRRELRFVAGHGLPADFLERKVVQLARSPLNRRVIEGEVWVHGHIGQDDRFQLQAELLDLNIRSVAFAPLKLEDRVIGILGAYCVKADRFKNEDTSFLRIAAELVAVAIENGRAWEAVESLMGERARFMLRVAHNMRAPLGASLSLLALVRDGSLGEVAERQREVLGRVERRLGALNQTVGDLLALARSRDLTRELPAVTVKPAELGEQLEEIFLARAQAKGVELRVAVAPGLPPLPSRGDIASQLLENLVSNAIKYTPAGGKVRLVMLREERWLRVEISDTGIGIPSAEQAHLFDEFFRASNARALHEEGTGLGLALARQTAERLGGSLRLASEEGEGTTVVVYLPLDPPAQA
ncbi:MAG: ATP-binding protein [Candidatus Krumholzibacteriia bacterium]|nr:GAF domain-containing protein [bacterium]